jgi:hypothetical protein
MNNLKEFKELILKYESITLEELKDIESEKNLEEELPSFTLSSITGFGTYECTLCTKAKENRPDCKNCIWEIKTGVKCIDTINHNTYDRIFNAETFEDLLDAIQKRADYMRNVIDWFEEKI